MRHVTRRTATSSCFFSTSTSLSSLLLLASLSKSLSNPNTISSAVNDPLPSSLLLPLLHSPSIPFSSKLHLLSLSPSSSLFSSLLLSLPPSSPHLLPLLRLSVQSSHPPTPSTLHSLLLSLLRAGRLDSAVQVLSFIPSLQSLPPSTVSSVILALLQSSHLSAALSILRSLLSHSLLPSPSAANATLSALRKAGHRQDFCNLLDKLRQLGFSFDAWTYNICIHAFGSWGRLAFALKLFKEMKSPDICSFNSVLHALCLAGRVQDALEVFDEMKSSGFEPDRFTYRTLILGCCKGFRIDEALRVFREMEYNNVKGDTLVYNNILDGLLKARKLDDACQMFERMVSEWEASCCYDDVQ
ncbi:putative tetratricopeptide-like helical domain superfamily [Dioscorea sansibarensis]